jgi:hypothetical protein
MESYFCKDRAYQPFLGLWAFESYKRHAEGLMDLELCPFEHDKVQINEIPYASGGQVEVRTTESWFEGPPRLSPASHFRDNSWIFQIPE